MSRRHRCAAHGWRPAAPDSLTGARRSHSPPGRQRHVSHRKPTAAAPPPRGSGIGCRVFRARSRVKLQTSKTRPVAHSSLSSRKSLSSGWGDEVDSEQGARRSFSALKALAEPFLPDTLRRGRPPPARAPREGRATGPAQRVARVHGCTQAVRFELADLSLKAQIRAVCT